MTNTYNSNFQPDALRRTTDTYHKAFANPLPKQGELLPIKPAALWANGEWERGLKYKTRSGILVRSKIEKIIADFFHSERMRFVYEPSLEVDGIYFRPDFYLPRYDLFYEHFGRADSGYRAAASAKISAYQRAKVNFICTSVEDEPEIEDAIVDQLAFATFT